MDKRFVAYYRVSTAKQGASGLGLEAQRRAVMDYLGGADGELVAEFQEIESGRRVDRPALLEAIERCRLTGAQLLIAKLDRLSRNVHFLSGLKERGVDFQACDLPDANRFTINIMAAVAEQEHEAISARTKAALGSIKARLAAGETHVSRRSGQPLAKLGSPSGLSVSRPDLGTQALVELADQFAARVRPTVEALRGEGMSLGGVAARLNDMRVRTPRYGAWTATAVKRILERPIRRVP